jgi:RNA polymerase-binding transcription factor DksA
MPVQLRNFEQIRQRLITRRSDLTVRRRRVEHDLARRNEPLAADFADQAIQVQNDEALQAIGDAAITEIIAINESLGRLERGLYGTCQRCGEGIESGRLLAVPHAVTCARCSGN